MVSGLGVMCVSLASVACGKIDQEGGPTARFALRRDPSAVPLDDLAADGEAHAGALVRAALVQPLEELEDAVHVPGLEADAVVGDGEMHFAVRRRAVDAHHRWFVGLAELERVADQ